MSTTSKPTVYIVDDDKSIRDSLRVLLKSAGIVSVGFASAEEFLEGLPENPQGCILLDVLLPKLGGLELMQELEELLLHVKM